MHLRTVISSKSRRGGVIVYGRSDATLNPVAFASARRRFTAWSRNAEIVDSIVVGRDTPDADVEVCLFVVLRRA